MKGLLSTDKYMRAILNKEKGLMPGKKNDMLTHIAVFQVPAYHKLLVCSDVAIIPEPDFKQKQSMLNYIISTAKSLEIAKPKVAVIAATEQVSVGMRACAEGAWLGMMSQRGQLKGAIVDGPLSLDCSIDKESAQTKKLTSEVAGDADGLLFPNIESGNVFYKCCTKFGGAELACMVVGAKVPCILTSRGDSAKTKLYSIALGCPQRQIISIRMISDWLQTGQSPHPSESLSSLPVIMRYCNIDNTMDNYFEGLKGMAITVCDTDGNILDMNQCSANVNSHGQKIIGNNLFELPSPTCGSHSEGPAGRTRS